MEFLLQKVLPEKGENINEEKIVEELGLPLFVKPIKVALHSEFLKLKPNLNWQQQ